MSKNTVTISDTLDETMISLYYQAELNVSQRILKANAKGKPSVDSAHSVGKAAGYALALRDVLTDVLGVQEWFLKEVADAAFAKAKDPEVCHQSNCADSHSAPGYCPCCANDCPDCYIDLGV